MRFFLASSLLLCLFMWTTTHATAQSQKELERKKQQLKKEIKFAQEQLSSIKKQQTNSVAALEMLDRKLDVREELISNISDQVEEINDNISEGQQLIKDLSKDIELLKSKYAEMIRQSYRGQRDYKELMFVFSATDLNDANKRLKYLKEYSKFRKRQAELILKTKETLIKEIDNLESRRTKKQDLLKEEEQQKTLLQKEKTEVDKKVKTLKKDQSTYTQKIKNRQAQIAKIDKEIERIIAAALRKKKAAKAKVTKGTSTAKDLASHNANIALSKSFATNKGKLPWPVERGTIIRGFGTKPHPLNPSLKINNNGVDISTEKNGSVRALFEGEVIEKLFNPSIQNCVIISHGDYFTVYSGLGSVQVNVGDKISTKQVIGKAHTNAARTEIHLEIWKGMSKLNPSLWLYK